MAQKGHGVCQELEYHCGWTNDLAQMVIDHAHYRRNDRGGFFSRPPLVPG